MESILQIISIISFSMSGLAIILVLAKNFKKLVKTMEINSAKVTTEDLLFQFIECFLEIIFSLIPIINIYIILQSSLYLANMIKEN